MRAKDRTIVTIFGRDGRPDKVLFEKEAKYESHYPRPTQTSLKRLLNLIERDPRFGAQFQAFRVAPDGLQQDTWDIFFYSNTVETVNLTCTPTLNSSGKMIYKYV